MDVGRFLAPPTLTSPALHLSFLLLLLPFPHPHVCPSKVITHDVLSSVWDADTNWRYWRPQRVTWTSGIFQAFPIDFPAPHLCHDPSSVQSTVSWGPLQALSETGSEGPEEGAQLTIPQAWLTLHSITQAQTRGWEFQMERKVGWKWPQWQIGNKRAGGRELDGRRKGILFWERIRMRQAFQAHIWYSGLLLPGFSI